MATNFTDKINKLVKSYKNLPIDIVYPKTILEIFNRSYDENFISDYLAYILNPFENGIGIEPLRRLLSLKEEDKQLLSMLDNINKDDFEIFREYCFKNQRRIDILIIIKKQLVIGIENKIFSTEGYRQTKDYFNSIKKELKSITPILFFLSPDKHIPESKSFSPLSYYELAQIFQGVDLGKSSNNHSRELFKDFLIHINKKIMTNQNYQITEKFKLFIKNVKIISDLEENFSSEADSFMEYLFEKIKLLYSQSEENKWEFNFSKKRVYHFVYRPTWAKNKIFLHFEYWFTKDGIFKDKEMQFMIEVEGKNKDRFHEKFRHIFPKIKSKYKLNSILYRPEVRTRAIAYKEYKFDGFSDKFEEQIFRIFKKSFNDFKFLIPYLDKIMDKK